MDEQISVPRRRFGAALELHEDGVAIMRQNIRRRNPEATTTEIEAMLRHWLEGVNLENDLRSSGTNPIA